MTSTGARPATTDTAFFDVAAGATARGTLVLLAGRGEHPGVYSRFGRRIASDGYRVHIVSGSGNDPEAAGSLAAGLLAGADPARPRVLAGSDTGAALALRAGTVGGADIEAGIGRAEPVAGTSRRRAGAVLPDAVVVAALPLGPAVTSLADRETRSACPLHNAVLADAANLDAGALGTAVEPSLLPEPEEVGVPVLAFHGEADAVVPVDDAVEWADRLPRGRLVVGADGLRDVFNDKIHRSVAATIVLFLEELGAGGPVLR
jgi:alpha-beta hydrolase superfamily lysophospholipase